MRIFLESEEYWFEDFKVDNLTEAISIDFRISNAI